MRLSVPVAALLASLAFAAPAVAQEDKVYAPPGNSGIDEYLEVVPGGGGDQAANGGANGDSGAAPTPAEAIGADNASKLEALGPEGEAAAAAAAAGSSDARKAARKRAKDQGSGDAAKGESIASRSEGDRVTTVARALSGDGGGMGTLFPIVLLLTLGFALTLVVARRLRRG